MSLFPLSSWIATNSPFAGWGFGFLQAFHHFSSEALRFGRRKECAGNLCANDHLFSLKYSRGHGKIQTFLKYVSVIYRQVCVGFVNHPSTFVYIVLILL